MKVIRIFLIVFLLPALALLLADCGRGGNGGAQDEQDAVAQELGLERTRQATSVTNVVEFSRGVVIYIQDYWRIGAPKAADISELAAILRDHEIILNRSLIKDGWGNLLVYQVDMTPGSRHFSVISYGSDGAEGPAVAPDENGKYIVRRFDEDIIYRDGALVQYPEDEK